MARTWLRVPGRLHPAASVVYSISLTNVEEFARFGTGPRRQDIPRKQRLRKP